MKNVICRFLLLVIVACLSTSSIAGITDDEKTVLLVVHCTVVFGDKANASMLYQKDRQQFEVVYRLIQQDIRKRYSIDDGDKIWMKAMVTVADHTSKQSASKRVEDCRKFVDGEIDYFTGMGLVR